jgi:hypothetical protein
MNKNIFVFVVCGAAEHIETLHFSLKYLQHFSKNEVIVVTDSARNEIAINHDHIIDVKVDKKHNHHQASIYLKTGLNKFLPKGNNYCYLDTDVIAVSEDCDQIFNDYIAPITFAQDHCKIRNFSSYAVHCNCTEEWDKNKAIFYEHMKSIERNRTTIDPFLLKKADELQLLFDQLKKSFFKKVYTAIKFVISYPVFKLNKEFYFNRKSRTWHISSGEIVMYDTYVEKSQEKPNGIYYNKWNQKWYDKEGNDIWQDECDHLLLQIAETFEIKIKDKNWQHWNGGVFLFNNESDAFLNAWHQKTMHIFTLPNWKTRDQGTLIATAWEFGLNNHATLSKKWNFIADYYKKSLKLNSNEGLITDDDFKTSYKPILMHVYHNWGKQDWDVWQWIENKIS